MDWLGDGVSHKRPDQTQSISSTQRSLHIPPHAPFSPLALCGGGAGGEGIRADAEDTEGAEGILECGPSAAWNPSRRWPPSVETHG